MGRRSNALQAYKLRRVIDFMNRHLAEAFSLADLAEAAQLSEYHFSRLFKRATDCAVAILHPSAQGPSPPAAADRSIIDIGMEVGCSSPGHFSQVFRDKVGITPSAYRSPEHD